MHILEKIARYSLRKKAAHIKRKLVIPESGTLKKIGVLWQYEGKEAFKFIHDHFSESHVIVRNLCIYDKKTQALPGVNVITPKDLNWLGLPEPGTADEFINTEFDLLFNIILNQNLVSDYITAMSKAHFKLGWSPAENNFFDLNINIQKEPDAMYLARQQIFYLGQFFQT